jgi:pimeloyl-ACP methyl ester carboxylesterase
MNDMSRRALLLGASASLACFDVRSSQAKEGVAAFHFRASDAALDDLHSRLDRVRWPERETANGWDQGPPLAAMQALVSHWRYRYNWRNAEAELAQWPQFKTALDDLTIHFIHVRSPHASARPLVLTHGWPSTVLLFRDVIKPLTDPTAHGGSSRDAFHVVIPSLPGFGFSDKPAARGWNAERTGRAWGQLMQRLGYSRWFAQGGDWGAFVTTAMAQQHVPGLAAIHLNFAQTIPDALPSELLPDQRRAVEAMKQFRERHFGYGMLQATKPQLAGYTLSDSPMAQAAWLYDIFNGGTGYTGRPEDFIPRDKMLDEITLFWLTDSAASSARFYLEEASLLGLRNNPGRVDLPVAITVFPHDMPVAKTWANDVYPNLISWREASRGGHFVQLEEPELFVEELRSAFRSIEL